MPARLPVRPRGTSKQTVRPIITLTSDFGMHDSYVAEMKAVLLAGAGDAALVDVTHQIPPQDVLAGSIAIERVLRVFPRRTVHLAVIDPGVGTNRGMLIVEIAGQFIVCPDNGLITWPWRRLGPGKAFSLPMPVGDVSRTLHTFHGRDIFAPAAAQLAGGAAPAKLGKPAAQPVLLEIYPAGRSGGKNPPRDCRIIYIDGFGNAVTNLPQEAIGRGDLAVSVGGESIGRVRQTYGDVEIGRPLALIGSSGLLEIAVRNGSAARKLRITIGQRVQLKYFRR